MFFIVSRFFFFEASVGTFGCSSCFSGLTKAIVSCTDACMSQDVSLFHTAVQEQSVQEEMAKQYVRTLKRLVKKKVKYH